MDPGAAASAQDRNDLMPCEEARHVPAPVAYGQAFATLRSVWGGGSGPTLAQPLLQVAHGFLDLFFLDRLEQVVGRMDLESGHGIVGRPGHEDQQWCVGQ